MFFNKYKYRLERCHELISELILSTYPVTNDKVNKFDAGKRAGLEQARRVIKEFIEHEK